MLIEKFNWDMTYACPLRCAHCYSESGRRAARSQRDTVSAIAEVIAAAKPNRISLTGGEPLIVEGWAKAARRIRDAGTQVTLFTSGWTVDEEAAAALADSVTNAVVSVDGATAATHDALRRREGAFRHAMDAIALLAGYKRARVARGEPCYALGVDCTVTRSGFQEMDRLVAEVTELFPEVDFMRFAMALPSGPASEEDFVARELLTDEESAALVAAEGRLAAAAKSAAKVSVTDMVCFLPYVSKGDPALSLLHVEPDGDVRAYAIYEAKIGNVLEEPIETLWNKALAWRRDPEIVAELSSIKGNADWARVTRTLDRRYGSSADKARIALRVKRESRSAA
ncbi:Radical SAM, Pyruvate-formate lyase-activating enzyme [Minicystis rosea]|nr:Radical SAM, Pyruvate-formate lyase-activating enzyme [Minicystis rosea]